MPLLQSLVVIVTTKFVPFRENFNLTRDSLLLIPVPPGYDGSSPKQAISKIPCSNSASHSHFF